MLKLIKTFCQDEAGATAIEYALLASLIGVALIGAFMGLGDTMVEMYNGNDGSLSSAMQDAMDRKD